MASSLKLFSEESGVPKTLRIGSRLDKYRIVRRLGEGGFATVYAAHDTIEDRRVALKIPDSRYVSNPQSVDDLQREVRIMAMLNHPGILTLRDARFVEGHFVMVFPMGEETLLDRFSRRIARANAVDYALQMIDAVSYAHEHRVLHRDIKPENFILFPNQIVRLTDFGLARVQRTGKHVSASGTLGYMAPEQAMGHPDFRSDVFSLGLVLYRLFSGELPDYPFEAPLPGYQKLRRGLSSEFVALIRKAIDPSPKRRFRDAIAMQNAVRRIRFPLSDRSVTQTGRSETTSRISHRRVA
ncbi:Serine/threonine-protein kinase PrkC [Novipirellula galeiformis]|uniref:Serine/threonine-protein kinase PrkC n=1 Tax=Novipirellula galeiformis TaxID=2528004 RepID=A0A5C6CLH1_9BACT|nr:serine/threonine-protein kinase [Novipirellula galeiformis]TWU24925.1 Serine/threonine-protein kinase PrkC [Novipirellula galeiformis]